MGHFRKARQAGVAFHEVVAALAVVALVGALFWSVIQSGREEAAKELRAEQVRSVENALLFFGTSLARLAQESPKPLPAESLAYLVRACAEGKRNIDALMPVAAAPYRDAFRVVISGCAKIGRKQASAPPVTYQDVTELWSAVFTANQLAYDELNDHTYRGDRFSKRQIEQAPEQAKAMASWPTEKSYSQ